VRSIFLYRSEWVWRRKDHEYGACTENLKNLCTLAMRKLQTQILVGDMDTNTLISASRKNFFDQLLLCRCAWFTWMKILEKNCRHIPFCPYPMECKRDLKPTKIINLRCYTAQKSMEIFFLFDNSSYAVIFIHDFCYCKMHYVTQPRHISFS